jgi:hypothetical protein
MKPPYTHYDDGTPYEGPRLDGFPLTLMMIADATEVSPLYLLPFAFAVSIDAKWLCFPLALVMLIVSLHELVRVGHSIDREAADRRRFFIPLFGCAFHVALVGISVYLMWAAGPHW